MQVRTGPLPEHVDGDGDDAERQAIRDLMDPVALEARLVVARARRAEVLAARAGKSHSRDDARHGIGPEGTVSAPVTSDDVLPDADAKPAVGPLSFPLPREMAPPSFSDPAPHPTVEPADAAAEAPVAPEPGRRVPTRLVARREGALEAPQPMSRMRRTTVLVAAILLAGIALGAASTLLLQFRGWQIAILPPESAPKQAAAVESSPAPIDVVVVDPPAAPPPAGSDAPEAAAPPPPVVGPEKHDLFEGFAFAGEGPPATVAWPAPGEPIEVGSLPELASAKPAGLLDAQIEELLRPAPTPLVMAALQTLSFGLEPPQSSAGPVEALDAPAADAPGRVDRPSALPVPQNDASPQPPAPGTIAEPRTSTVPPPARIAVHFPAAVPAGAEKVAAELNDVGFSDVRSYPVSMQISSTQVRYFHEADRAAAEQAAASASAALGGADVTVRSFTDFRPKPEEGLLEIWLEGDAPARAPRVSARRAETPAVSRSAPAEAPAEADRRISRQEAERQRMIDAVEELLRTRLQ